MIREKEKVIMEVKQKKRPSTVVIIFILTVVMLLGCYWYLQYIENQYAEEAEELLKTELNQMAGQVNKKLDLQYTNLQYIEGFVTKDTVEFDAKQAIDKIIAVKTGNEFSSMGIIDLEGNLYMATGNVIDVSDEDFFKQAVKNDRYMSNTIVDDKGNLINAYTLKININDDCVGYVFATDDVNELKDEMNVPDTTLAGRGCIVDGTTGTIITNNLYADEFLEGFSIYSYYTNKGYNKVSKRIKDAIEENGPECIKVKFQNEDYIMYGERININNWYIISSISPDEMSENKNSALLGSNLFIGILLIVYLLTIILIIFIQEKNKKNIERLAYVDEITGGDSFTKFKMNVEKLVMGSNDDYAMVDIDVDRFKFINDIFGYEEGNRVIRYIWKEIGEIVENGETYAHRSADEFVALLKYKDIDELGKRLEALSERTAGRTFQIEKNYDIVLSMGIYLIDNENFNIDSAIDRAVLTKKSVKGKHSKLYAIYDDKMREKIIRDQHLENLMEKALEREEFKVYYQPKYDSNSCELAGAEALVRWYNEEEGMIYPNEFIPLFESNGFITILDKYMFDHVCRDIKNWLEAGYSVVPVSVNLSQLQLYNSGFIDEYKEIIEKYDIPPEYVQLELTETTLFSKISTMNEIIDNLHSIGFKILMDDFGTGYSSLNMLKNVKVDVLKLDKSFVDDIGETKGNIVVSSIVSLGQLLNMKIVAEGVETQEQFEFLRDIFCDEIQGYYFSKPIPKIEYEKLLTKGAL